MYNSIDSHNTTRKEMSDQIEKQMMDTSIGTQVKVTSCINRYESFKAKEGDLLEATYERFSNLLNELKKNGITKTPIKNNIKFLTNLQSEWKSYSTFIFQN